MCVCGGGGGENLRQAPARKTKDAVDRRQNSRMLRQCPLATAQQLVHCAVAVPTAVPEQSHKDNFRSSAAGKQLLMQKKSSSQAELHLPTLDLFWANLRVQHHLPALDLVWTR